jgi:hypothetical protein
LGRTDRFGIRRPSTGRDADAHADCDRYGDRYGDGDGDGDGDRYGDGDRHGDGDSAARRCRPDAQERARVG